MHDSRLKFISLGYVTKDIDYANDSVWIEAYPIENVSTANGDIDATDLLAINSADSFGEVTDIKLNRSVKIMAKWLNGSNYNRLTPPTIYKGMTIKIYRYGSTDKYFWESHYLDLDLRLREKATFIFSNKGKIGESLLDKIYYFTVNTINKYIRLHTDDSDGELTTYDLEINTKDGYLVIEDGKENSIQLDSDKEDLITNINNDVTTKIGNDKNTNIGNNENVTIGNSKQETIGSRYDIKLKNFSVRNDSDELISLLVETMQAIIDIKHTGNLGIATSIESSSKIIFEDLKSRYSSFM